MFENRVLRIMYGPKRKQQEAGENHTCIIRGFINLYCSPNSTMTESLKIRWAGHAACMGETEDAYNLLIRKPEEMRIGKTWA